MIRGILFDYGGVVANGGPGIGLARQVGAALGLDNETADSVIYPLFQQNTRGQLTTEQFWQKMAEYFGRAISDEERHLWDSWWSTKHYPEMDEVISKLKQHNYQVGLLSNVLTEAAASLRAAGCYDNFDFAILSCEVGYAKPDTEMYELAMSKFKNLQPSEIVFIDDQEKCMPPAEAMGMQTILATDTNQVITDLQKLGLPV
jgi:putative hydrolase of the HAD superfamily